MSKPLIFIPVLAKDFNSFVHWAKSFHGEFCDPRYLQFGRVYTKTHLYKFISNWMDFRGHIFTTFETFDGWHLNPKNQELMDEIVQRSNFYKSIEKEKLKEKPMRFSIWINNEKRKFRGKRYRSFADTSARGKDSLFALKDDTKKDGKVETFNSWRAAKDAGWKKVGVYYSFEMAYHGKKVYV